VAELQHGFRELDDKHNVVDNTKQAAAATWNKAKEFNQEYQIAKDQGSGRSQGRCRVHERAPIGRANLQQNGKVPSVVAQELSSDPDTLALP
jgi:hypothetical protein